MTHTLAMYNQYEILKDLYRKFSNVNKILLKKWPHLLKGKVIFLKN